MAKRTKGKSVAIPSHSWKKEGGAIEGFVEKVVRFIGTEYEGEEDKVQCRILLLSEDRAQKKFVYLPARWVDLAAPLTGAYVWITSSEPGSKKTRYDLIPEDGFKPIAVTGIETVRHDGLADGPE